MPAATSSAPLTAARLAAAGQGQAGCGRGTESEVAEEQSSEARESTRDVHRHEARSNRPGTVLLDGPPAGRNGPAPMAGPSDSELLNDVARIRRVLARELETINEYEAFARPPPARGPRLLRPPGRRGEGARLRGHPDASHAGRRPGRALRQAHRPGSLPEGGRCASPVARTSTPSGRLPRRLQWAAEWAALLAEPLHLAAACTGRCTACPLPPPRMPTRSPWARSGAGVVAAVAGGGALADDSSSGGDYADA